MGASLELEQRQARRQWARVPPRPCGNKSSAGRASTTATYTACGRLGELGWGRLRPAPLKLLRGRARGRRSRAWGLDVPALQILCIVSKLPPKPPPGLATAGLRSPAQGRRPTPGRGSKAPLPQVFSVPSDFREDPLPQAPLPPPTGSLPTDLAFLSVRTPPPPAPALGPASLLLSSDRTPLSPRTLPHPRFSRIGFLLQA